VGAEVLDLVLKLAFHRARPEVGVVHLDTYSYPSGHAMAAAAMCTTFAYLLARRTRSRRLRGALVLGAAAVVATIAFSRLYLGAHYLSDVLAGISAGVTWAALSIALALTVGDGLVAAIRRRAAARARGGRRRPPSGRGDPAARGGAR
jgi:undecaprenyl-diphosphatase